MFREMDARATERERAEPDCGGRGGGTPMKTEGPEGAREALTHDLDLPRGQSRERVQAHGREYRLSGSEVRVLGRRRRLPRRAGGGSEALPGTDANAALARH